VEQASAAVRMLEFLGKLSPAHRVRWSSEDYHSAVERGAIALARCSVGQGRALNFAQVGYERISFRALESQFVAECDEQDLALRVACGELVPISVVKEWLAQSGSLVSTLGLKEFAKGRAK